MILLLAVAPRWLRAAILLAGLASTLALAACAAIDSGPVMPPDSQIHE